MGEQTNRSTLGSLLQDTREREREGEKETGNDDDDGDSYDDDNDGDSHGDNEDADYFYNDDEIQETTETVDWLLTGKDSTFAGAYNTQLYPRRLICGSRREAGT